MPRGLIIAATRVIDAVQDALPFVAQHKAASEQAVVLDLLFVDTLMDWEDVLAGHLTAEDITHRRTTLLKNNVPKGATQCRTQSLLARRCHQAAPAKYCEARAYLSGAYQRDVGLAIRNGETDVLKIPPSSRLRPTGSLLK